MKTGTSTYWTVLREVFSKLWIPKTEPHFLSLRVRFVLGLTLNVLSVTLILLLPQGLKSLIGILSAPVPVYGWIVGGVAFYSFLYFFHNLFWSLQEVIFGPVVFAVAKKLQYDTFNHLHALSLRFHLERKAGALSNILSHINRGLYRMVMVLIFYIFPMAVEIIATAFILAFTFKAKYGWIVFGMSAVYALISFLLTRYYGIVQEFANRADNEVSGLSLDSFLNYSTVKYFNNLDFEQDRLKKSLNLRMQANVRKERTLLFMFTAHGIVTAIALACIIWFASRDVYFGLATIGDLVLINAYLLQIVQPLSWVGVTMGEVSEIMNNLKQVYDLHQEGPEVLEKKGVKPLEIKEASIEFQNVCFSYEEKRPILQNVSFKVNSGETVAIVGSTGSGKSTLSHLLYRFYDLTEGRILISGQDIVEGTLESLRQAIGIVPQEAILFNDTIFFNIRYGKRHASEQEVFEAAKLAGLHDFIEQLPLGYQTSVGERGLKISGGEKQRLAIARCLLKKPKIYIFDEATSALDTQTERKIQENISQISKKTTALIIAHRLSTIVEADRIIVLEKGVIVEEGTHQELLQNGKTYALLWQQQQRTRGKEEKKN